MSTFASRLYTAQDIEVPNARLNPGDDTVPPFATVQLTNGTYIVIYSWTEAYALRDAFQKAADLLSEATP